VNDLITHIILVSIMLISLIITLLIINSYRKNSIKIYNKITKSDQISKDQLSTVEEMGKKLQEKFYSLDKQVDELLEKIEKFKENIKK
jgi:peptidoglycan hydrolase CwlO-like protein